MGEVEEKGKKRLQEQNRGIELRRLERSRHNMDHMDQKLHLCLSSTEDLCSSTRYKVMRAQATKSCPTVHLPTCCHISFALS